MSRRPQIFDWEHEPVREKNINSPARPSRPPSDAAWRLLREPVTDRDRTLSALAIKWLDDFPATLKPVRLCDKYPRIANRLALSWPDPALASRVLKELTEDRRGGRQGFPQDIAKEIAALRTEASRRRTSAGG